MTLTPSRSHTQEIVECGWKDETIIDEQGQASLVMIPLTSEEFLHPQEGYHLPITSPELLKQAGIDLSQVL